MNTFFDRNKYSVSALLVYAFVVIFFTDLTDTYQLIVLIATLLTLPPVFNFRLSSRSIWINILSGLSISFYLTPSGFHTREPLSAVNSLLVFPHQTQFCFWSLIVILNTLHSIHRITNQRRLEGIKETLADKRGDMIDELLTPVKRRIRKIDYFL